MYELLGKDSPAIDLDYGLQHYVEWFFDLDNGYRLQFDGGLHPIGQWVSQWAKDFGILLTWFDRFILLAMDKEYRDGMAKIRAKVVAASKDK